MSPSYSTAVWPGATPYAGSSRSSTSPPSTSRTGPAARRPVAQLGLHALGRQQHAPGPYSDARPGERRAWPGDHAAARRIDREHEQRLAAAHAQAAALSGREPVDAVVPADHAAVLVTTSPLRPAPPCRSTKRRWSPPPTKQTSWLSRRAAASSPAARACLRVSVFRCSPSGNHVRARIGSGTRPACTTDPCQGRPAGQHRAAVRSDHPGVVASRERRRADAVGEGGSASKRNCRCSACTGSG